MPTTRTYFRHPVAADGNLTAFGASGIADGDVTQVNSGTVIASANRSATFTFGRPFLATTSQVAFLRCDFGLISAALTGEDRINSAKLRLLPNVTTSFGTLNAVSVALLARDAVWDDLSGSGYTVVSGGDVRCTMTTTSGSVTTHALPDVSLLIPIKNSTDGFAPNQWGQTIKSTLPTSALTSFTARMNSTGGAFLPSGQVLVYAAAANDGSNDLPTGSILAASDFSTLAGVNPFSITFVFSGPNQISIVSGNRYVFIIDAVYAQSATNFITARIRGATDAYADGNAIIGGETHYAFHESCFPIESLWPQLYQVDGTTIKRAPFGSVLGFNVADLTSGTYFEFDVTTLVREWIEHPSFAANVIGFVINPSGAAEFGPNTRSFSDFELLLNIVDEQQLSGTISGVVGTDPNLSLQNGMGGTTSGVVGIVSTLGLQNGFGGEISGVVGIAPDLSLQNGFAGEISGVVGVAPNLGLQLGFGGAIDAEVLTVPPGLFLRAMFASIINARVTIGGDLALIQPDTCRWFTPVTHDWFDSGTHDWFEPKKC